MGASNIECSNPNAEGPFLLALFAALQAQHVSYCVLRNYETLPDSLGGSDLDLLLSERDLDVLTQIVVSIADEYGGKVISQYRTSGRYLKILGMHNGQWWGTAVDLMPGVDFRGMIYVGGEGLISRSVCYRGISVARESDAAIMALLKEMVNNSRDRKNYLLDACACYDKHGDVCLKLLKETFSNGLIIDFRNMLENRAGNDVAGISSRLRLQIWKKCGIRQGVSVLSNSLRRYGRLLKPPGASLAVTGTDGAGKTTIIEAIRPVLEQAIHNEIQYEHLRPNWLRSLATVSGKHSKENSIVCDPHSRPTSGVMGSLFRVIYYWFDYVIGYGLKIFPSLVKKSHICLFDRYYYDMIMDPRRMRINLPSWMLRILFYWVPRPQLLLCLGAEPRAIYERKPETSLEEVTRQVSELKQLCHSNQHAVWIDTGCGIEESMNQALSAIQYAMSSRYSK